MTPRLALALAILALLLMPAIALGHDDAGRLEIDPGMIPAGSALSVRGIAVGADETVSLTLVAAGGASFELGAAETDEEGGFETIAIVPSDVDVGTYVVRATLSDGDVVEAEVVVQAALLDGGEQRGEEEALLQPMPTGQVGSAVPATSPAPEAATPTASRTSPAVPPVAIVGLALLLIALTALVSVARLRRLNP